MALEKPLNPSRASGVEDVMLWFYSRDGESLSLETRYDNQTLEYISVLIHPDGRRETERFMTAECFREWLLTLDQQLLSRQWTQNGPPHILPDGWPDKAPRQ